MMGMSRRACDTGDVTERSKRIPPREPAALARERVVAEWRLRSYSAFLSRPGRVGSNPQPG